MLRPPPPALVSISPSSSHLLHVSPDPTVAAAPQLAFVSKSAPALTPEQETDTIRTTFWGQVELEAMNRMLGPLRSLAGTWLWRQSSSDANNFTISSIDTTGDVNHIRMVPADAASCSAVTLEFKSVAPSVVLTHASIEDTLRYLLRLSSRDATAPVLMRVPLHNPMGTSPLELPRFRDHS